MSSRPTIRARTQKLCRCFPQRVTLVLLFLGLDLICLPNHAHCLSYQISGHGGSTQYAFWYGYRCSPRRVSCTTIDTHENKV